jgi:TonB family protein
MSTSLFAQEVDTTSENNNVFRIVESAPQFVGGQEGLIKFLGKNLRYPETAKKAGVQGKVVVKFIIEADGTVSKPEIVKGVNKELDEEAIRVIKKMPKWMPGQQQGVGVRTQQTLPLTFKL